MDIQIIKPSDKVRKQRSQHQWDLYFLKLAELVATKSRDESLKVGCVIVGPDNEIRSTGYNGFCRGCTYTYARMDRPAKNDWTEHAERNAIYHAARMGTPLKGCTAYVACNAEIKRGNVPCLECSRAFIQAGIVTIVQWNVPSVQMKEENGTWRDKLKTSLSMLHEVGMRLRYVCE